MGTRVSARAREALSGNATAVWVVIPVVKATIEIPEIETLSRLRASAESLMVKEMEEAASGRKNLTENVMKVPPLTGQMDFRNHRDQEGLEVTGEKVVHQTGLSAFQNLREQGETLETETTRSLMGKEAKHPQTVRSLFQHHPDLEALGIGTKSDRLGKERIIRRLKNQKDFRNHPTEIEKSNGHSAAQDLMIQKEKEIFHLIVEETGTRSLFASVNKNHLFSPG